MILIKNDLADFKHENAFSEIIAQKFNNKAFFSSKIPRSGTFGPNIGIFCFSQNFTTCQSRGY